MVVDAFATGSVTARDGQPSESDIAHDHIRLRQHQIGPIARIAVHIRAKHVQHSGTIQRGETVGARRAAVSSAGVGARP